MRLTLLTFLFTAAVLTVVPSAAQAKDSKISYKAGLNVCGLLEAGGDFECKTKCGKLKCEVKCDKEAQECTVTVTERRGGLKPSDLNNLPQMTY